MTFLRTTCVTAFAIASAATLSGVATAADLINTGTATLTSDPSSDQFLLDGVETYAFAFTTTDNYDLTDVSVYARALSDLGGNIEFTIAQNIDGQPGTPFFGCTAAATTARTSYGCALNTPVQDELTPGSYFLEIGADAPAALVVEGNGSVPSFAMTPASNGYQSSNTPANILLQGTLSDAGTTPAVPEPASWAMMVGGFGLIGGAMRRRTRATMSLA